jgi:hypothetical protein
MTAKERLQEMAEILAVGILRLKRRKGERKGNNFNGLREFSLDFTGNQSMHGRHEPKGGERS